MDAVLAALAFVARRQAARSLSAARWSHVLSFELGWMDPGQARSFVERARRAGLLREEGGLLRLAVDPARIEVPRGFRPDPLAEPAALAAGPGDAAAPDPFAGTLERVAAATGRGRDVVLAEVAARQARLGGLLGAEAALLWIASEAGLDVREDARAAGARLRPASRGAAPAPGPEGRP